MFTVTTVSGFKMILEDAGRDANGDQLWRQVEVGLGNVGPPVADPITFADTCCGKCPFGTCYVDQMTGA